MASWRKQQGTTYNHQVAHWNRSYSRRPPLDWQVTVPSWEKRFCATVGSVPWRKLLETKKYMYFHENIVKWDDSAGREAFDNAKTRFWAQINGLPCNLSLPDPDIYIDNVDWDSSVDPELILDLEREPAPSEEGNDNNEVVVLGCSHILNQSFYCTGWGDAETDLQPTGWDDSDINVTGWGEAETDPHRVTIPFPAPTGWDDPHLNVNTGVTGWGEAETNTIPYPPPHPQGWNSDLNVYRGVDYNTGWEMAAEPNLPKASNYPAPQGWQSNLQVNSGVGSWEQYYVPQEAARESQYEWKNYGNNSWGWNETHQQRGGRSEFQRMGRGRGSGSWGRRDNNNNNAYHGNNNDEYQNRGRRNYYRGRKRGNYAAYGRPYADNIGGTARWEVKIK